MREIFFIIGWAFLSVSLCSVASVLFGLDYDRMLISAALSIAIGAHYRGIK